MLLALMFLSAIVFVVIAPAMTLRRYYSPHKRSILSNILWVVVSIVTWPLIPIVLAAQKHDELILSMFWLSFLIGGVATGYWVSTNSAYILEFQHRYLSGI